MITVSNPRVELTEDCHSVVFYADFFENSDHSSENAAVAGKIIEIIADRYADYRPLPSDDLPTERDLIPRAVAEKPENPIKSIMLLNAFEHPELSEEYGRGCLRVVCSDPKLLKDILSGMRELSQGYAPADIDKAFAAAQPGEAGGTGSRDRLLPANFQKPRMILRRVKYDDAAGQPHTVFMALTKEQDAAFAEVGNPAAAVEQFAGAVVHRVKGRIVSAEDRKIAMDSFRAQQLGAGAGGFQGK